MLVELSILLHWNPLPLAEELRNDDDIDSTYTSRKNRMSRPDIKDIRIGDLNLLFFHLDIY